MACHGHHQLNEHELQQTPGDSEGQGSLVCYSSWGHKELDTTYWLNRVSLVAQRLKYLPAIWETWVRSLGQEDPLEKEMATHSSILAWRIPWMEEPGGLQSTGLQRVGRDWATPLPLSDWTTTTTATIACQAEGPYIRTNLVPGVETFMDVLFGLIKLMYCKRWVPFLSGHYEFALLCSPQGFFLAEWKAELR